VIRRPLLVPEEMLSSPRPHRHAIASELPLTRTAPVQLPSAIRFVFLCFTNRCGSNHLGDLLGSTGIFEPPLESLNAGAVLSLCRERHIRSFPEYFENVVQRDGRTRLPRQYPEALPDRIIGFRGLLRRSCRMTNWYTRPWISRIKSAM
jgi:hypothetical protein